MFPINCEPKYVKLYFYLSIDTILKQYLHQFGIKKVFPKENLPDSELDHFCVSTVKTLVYYVVGINFNLK